MKTQLLVIAAIRKNNEYLLTRRVEFDKEDRQYLPFVWNLPGGGIQYFESPEKALKREMKEELGVEIDIENLIPKVFSVTRNKWHGIFISYLCQIKGNQKITLNEEADQWSWVKIKDIGKLKTLPLTKTICQEADKITP